MIKKGDIVNLTVENLVFGGEGVARLATGVDEAGRERRMAVFLDGVVAGDEVEAEIVALKRNLARARVKRFVKYGDSRVQPRCAHFGVNVDSDGRVDGRYDAKKNCGGCSWQMLDYDKQLVVKWAEVRDSLVRLGGIPANEVDRILLPTLGMAGDAAAKFPDGPWYYRNKMDFSFTRNPAGKLCLGLHMKGRFHDVTEIEECFLFRPWVGDFLRRMREFFEGLELVDGTILSSLIVRAGTNTGEVMVNLLVENGEVDFGENCVEVVREFWEAKSEKCKAQNVEDGAQSAKLLVKSVTEKVVDGVAVIDRLVSVFVTHIINKKGQPKRFVEKLLWGRESFREKLRVDGGDAGVKELSFDVAPQAFLQPNTKQAEVFYSLVRRLAGGGGKKRIFDLFCGTGTIAIVLADLAEKVVGIELNAPAVENARANAALNKADNLEWRVGDVGKLLPELAKEVDLIVVDPPRAGLSEKIIDTIGLTAAKELIYVSCNPTTLARDLKLFLGKGWKLDFAQPIDQFAQTYHIETVVKIKMV